MKLPTPKYSYRNAYQNTEYSVSDLPPIKRRPPYPLGKKAIKWAYLAELLKIPKEDSVLERVTKAIEYYEKFEKPVARDNDAVLPYTSHQGVVSPDSS